VSQRREPRGHRETAHARADDHYPRHSPTLGTGEPDRASRGARSNLTGFAQPWGDDG
jgi:hypothetical protein